MNGKKPERIFQGNGVSPGIVLGQALKLDSHNRATLKIRINDDRLVEEEVRRVERAIQASREQLEGLKSRLEEKVGREHSFIMDVHLLMLEDKSLRQEIIADIRSHRANAEWAVRQTSERILHAYESLEDEYFRDRKSDIEGVVERIFMNLSGDKPFNWKALPPDLIIVSRDFSPASFAQVDLQKVRGLALERGGRASHTAIIARSLRLPAVMEIRGFLSRVSAGDMLLINGDEGQVIVNPTQGRLDGLRNRLEESRTRIEPSVTQAVTPNATRDGMPVSLLANTELPEEVEAAKRCGAQGIGLFRSEFLYFGHPERSPSMEEQLAVYSMLAREMSPHPVAVRTLDAGADSVISGMELPGEPNPSMGMRGIRLSLVAQKSFRMQIEAILRAASAGKIEIVFPMVSAVEELREAKALVQQVRSSLFPLPGRDEESVPIGAMIEVPAAVLTLDVIAREVDFLCVGTNDLIQYLLAVDRGNPQVAHLFQPLHPSILHCLNRIAEVAVRLSKPARICGEISSNPFYAVLLLGMGFSQLSMNPIAIPAIRKVIQEVSLEDARTIARKTMTFATAREVGEYLIDAVSQLVKTNLSVFKKEITASSGRPHRDYAS
ncbi:MAG TPA: phosphoenolpyruvate--protein phosphotransferase [Acidobacteriota bacterium]|nr:phosphoenolpyruvate--protein phosphotransferase [Acidobacteriota bacterium]